MKDFDFDELDRAVNSVLTKKQANGTTDTASAQPLANVPEPQSVTPPTMADPVDAGPVDDPAVVTAPQQTDEPSSYVPDNPTEPTDDLPEVPRIDDMSAEPPVVVKREGSDENHDTPTEANPEESFVDNTDSSEMTTAPEADLIKVDALPHKRGRFMDVVPPSVKADASSRSVATPTHVGVTIAPSDDFKTDEEPSDQDVVLGAETASMVDEDHEPSTSEQDVTPQEPSVDSETHDTHDESSETQPPATMSVESISTPFIPDVPVEKRPLNSFPTGADASTDTDNDQPAPDQTTQEVVAPSAVPTPASLPKEFDEEIMAVEASETVGTVPDAADETVDASVVSPPPSNNSTPATTEAPSIAPQYHAPEEKVDGQEHPVFDAGSYHQPLAAVPAAHVHGSKAMWVIVVSVLFLIGAALGVLYFLYGQQ